MVYKYYKTLFTCKLKFLQEKSYGVQIPKMTISDSLLANLVNIPKGNPIMIFKVFILFLCKINVYDILYMSAKKLS